MNYKNVKEQVLQDQNPGASSILGDQAKISTLPGSSAKKIYRPALIAQPPVVNLEEKVSYLRKFLAANSK